VTFSAGRDEAEAAKFVERFASALIELGMPRMPSRVFSALFTADSGRLTAAELAEKLQVSAAAISGAVRYLSQVNMATRAREPGSRRDHYLVRDDLWQEAIVRRDQSIIRLEASLREGIEALGADTPAGARVAETLDFFEFLRGEMPNLLKKWHSHRAELASRRLAGSGRQGSAEPPDAPAEGAQAGAGRLVTQGAGETGGKGD
jgi:DNA-binding transcriptional regulator GbsR (MarR family)